jgi:hypothetical protein
VGARENEERAFHHIRAIQVISMMPTSAQATQTPETTERGDSQVLHMHRAHPTLPYMTAGDLKASAQAMTSRLPSLPRQDRLPSFPGRDLLFYGGLGALTVAGALEWPVALAIGGATYVLRGRGRKETQPGMTETAGPGRTTTEAKA